MNMCPRDSILPLSTTQQVVSYTGIQCIWQLIRWIPNTLSAKFDVKCLKQRTFFFLSNVCRWGISYHWITPNKNIYTLILHWRLWIMRNFVHYICTILSDFDVKCLKHAKIQMFILYTLQLNTTWQEHIQCIWWLVWIFVHYTLSKELCY